MCSHLSCKIRFEVPKRQRGREVRRERKDALTAKLILTIDLDNIEQKSLLQKL